MLELQGKIRDYSWGSLTAIPELLGNDPTGQPQAEYWLGGHPLAPATVKGTGLDEIFVSNPEWFDLSGDRYPVLMKILAADHPLSLQAHPDLRQAEDGYARENQAGIPLDAPHRLYRDPWAKPEILVALTDFDALCGFREPSLTFDLFSQLDLSPEIMDVVAPLGAQGDSNVLAEVFSDILAPDRPHLVQEVVRQASKCADDDTDLGLFSRTAVELNHFFPSHQSIVAALLLNRVHLEPGEGLYVPTSCLHSYLGGLGVEVMGCSDNVLRGGLTKKHVNVDELIRVVDFSASEVTPVSTSEDSGFTHYQTETDDFTLWRGELSSEEVEIPGSSTCRIALVVEGEAELNQGGTTMDLTAGQAVLLPAGDTVRARGSATLFVGAPGI
jgi:mannose-6-phosphate isomerase